MPLDDMIDIGLGNLSALLRERLPDEDARARAGTLFYQRLSVLAHRLYGGVIQTAPRVGTWSPAWLNAWYTPGVSAVSTTIRDDGDASFELTGRGNTVAVVSDSTRVLGDGDVTPPGGLGVMEGKAFLMKYLGGVDAVPLCVDSRGPDGLNDPERIIDFVKMVRHSFGAVNLEDISQPNCFRVLDGLRDACDIPVWHDDAQGTACVTLAGLMNAVELAGKRLTGVRVVLLGAGAANTTIARLLMAVGCDPADIVLLDRGGGLHAGRTDLESDPRAYRQWELAKTTNPKRLSTPAEVLNGADVLVALSTPGPDVVKPAWITSMASKAVVFACANPVPEIWPHAAREAGAFIVATGRGDFPNQVNNSLCFPGILKGALLVRARTISDGMAIRCARSMAEFARGADGYGPERILPSMEDGGLYERLAADTADQARLEGVARRDLDRDRVHALAAADIAASRRLFAGMMESGAISRPPAAMLAEAFEWAVERTKGS